MKVNWLITNTKRRGNNPKKWFQILFWKAKAREWDPISKRPNGNIEFKPEKIISKLLNFWSIDYNSNPTTNIRNRCRADNQQYQNHLVCFACMKTWIIYIILLFVNFYFFNFCIKTILMALGLIKPLLLDFC